jgi:hypothetical protein
MRKFVLIFTLTLALTAEGRDQTTTLLVRAWPNAPFARVSELGAGIGIIFTPDLSVPGNCRFYQALGFACFDSADWATVLDGIRKHNLSNPANPIRTLILETHGTNGNGLKLQTGKKPKDDRSYISVGGLQEQLEPYGIRYIILSACNSGRLLRPSIYRNLDPNPGDKLFLPATCGIHGASGRFNPRRSRITVITPGESHIETTLIGSIRELAPSTRKAIAAAAAERDVKLPKQFAISEMLIRMLTRDPRLQLRTGAHVEELSKTMTTARDSERIFKAFVSHLDGMVARDSTAVAGAR